MKAAGKLADGTAVSLNGQLVLDRNGRVWAPLFVAPVSYKGGAFFGVVEWVKPEDGPVFMRMLYRPATWMSRNPRATVEYGAGFNRTTGLSGGWYDTVGNLYEYYRGKDLLLATDSDAEAPVLLDGENGFEAFLWRPDEIPLAVVLYAGGEMVGLSAPLATSPIRPDGAFYATAGGNSLGLDLSFKRATGVFKGSFSAWFYHEDAPRYFCKRISYEGALTPEREGRSDGVEGRGFFLWGSRGQGVSAAGRTTTYPVNESYDLRLLSRPEF